MRVVRSSFWWLAGATCVAASIGACSGKFGSKGPDPEIPPPGPRPTYGTTVHADSPPPAISGGTLALVSGDLAVVSDPDRDRILVADLFAGGGVSEIALQPHDEPGRIALDDAARAHVVLRGGGAIVTVDLASATVIARRAV